MSKKVSKEENTEEAVEDRSEYNCVPCKGEGLLEDSSLCSGCAGKGKVE